MIDKNIVKKLDLITDHYETLVGIHVSCKGECLYKRYFNGFSSQDRIHIASITKSILSLLVGIAIEQGYIHNISDYVLDYFPDYTLKRGEKTLQNIRIHDVMTMTAPYKYKSEPYAKILSTPDWTKASLDLLGGRGSIGTFKYSTNGMQLLSAIITHTTGESLATFTSRNLFKPLSIATPAPRQIATRDDYMSFVKGHSTSGWIADSKGVHTGGWGLALGLDELSAIGQLCAQGGKYCNQQLIPEQWLSISTKPHSYYGALPYGYLWWIMQDKDYPGYMAIGDGGNILYICPSKAIVITILAYFTPRPYDPVACIKEILSAL